MNVFTNTLYRIPTDEELAKFASFPNMTAEDVLGEFQYTIIGRGILSDSNKSEIVKSIEKLCNLFAGNRIYQHSLELANKLGTRIKNASNKENTMSELAKKMKALAGIQENNKKFLKNIDLDHNQKKEIISLDEADKKKYIIIEFVQEEVEPGEDDDKLYKIK